MTRAPAANRPPTTVPRPRLLGLGVHDQPRGRLVVGELGVGLPFEVRRFFLVHGVPAGEVRGHHAHRSCEQLLVCLSGRLVVETWGRAGAGLTLLEDDAHGFHVPPLTWATQTYLEPNSALLVLCSEAYDPDEYVTDEAELRRLVRDSAGSPPAFSRPGRIPVGGAT